MRFSVTLLLFYLLVTTVFQCAAIKQPRPNLFSSIFQEVNGGSQQLRVMTANTWQGGGFVRDGLRKLAQHILLINPDIVVLQELKPGSLNEMIGFLGNLYVGAQRKDDVNPDTGILTKHLIDPNSCGQTDWAFGCNVTLRNAAKSRVNVWSVHFNYRDYGPYAACGRSGNPTSAQRIDNLMQLRKHEKFVSNMLEVYNAEVPVILAGDFNEPSHLDWTEQMRSAHCGHAVEWELSKEMEVFGFSDLYRIVHQNPLVHPGITWSTVQKFGDGNEIGENTPEPQDRIDFIFFMGSTLRGVECATYQGNGPNAPHPNVFENNWPSDHYGVYGDFRLDFQ